MKDKSKSRLKDISIFYFTRNADDPLKSYRHLEGIVMIKSRKKTCPLCTKCYFYKTFIICSGKEEDRKKCPLKDFFSKGLNVYFYNIINDL